MAKMFFKTKLSEIFGKNTSLYGSKIERIKYVPIVTHNKPVECIGAITEVDVKNDECFGYLDVALVGEMAYDSREIVEITMRV